MMPELVPWVEGYLRTLSAVKQDEMHKVLGLWLELGIRAG